MKALLAEIKKLFLEILDTIDTVAITAKQEKEDRFIATIACKAAVKANTYLNNFQMQEIIRNWRKCEKPFTCPHGRPTMISMSKAEIEKKFKRIV